MHLGFHIVVFVHNSRLKFNLITLLPIKAILLANNMHRCTKEVYLKYDRLLHLLLMQANRDLACRIAKRMIHHNYLPSPDNLGRKLNWGKERVDDGQKRVDLASCISHHTLHD